MARYLSPEWLAEFDAAGASEAVRAAVGDTRLTLQQIVIGADEPDVRYSVRVGDGRLGVSAGDDRAADATITVDHATAVALARGNLSLHDALVAGRITIGGDPTRLLGASGALTAIAVALDGLRATTTY